MAQLSLVKAGPKPLLGTKKLISIPGYRGVVINTVTPQPSSQPIGTAMIGSTFIVG